MSGADLADLTDRLTLSVKDSHVFADTSGSDVIASGSSATYYVDNFAEGISGSLDDTGLDTADNLSNTGIINVNLANIEPEDGAGWQYKIGEDDWQTGEGSSFVLPNPDGETTYDASTILVRQVDAVGNASEAYSLEQASRLADAATAAVDLAVEAEGVAETKADEASAATAEVARIQVLKRLTSYLQMRQTKRHSLKVVRVLNLTTKIP